MGFSAQFPAKKGQGIEHLTVPLRPKLLHTLQPEMIAKLIPNTLFHVTEMRFSKKIILKQFFHVILWITNEYVIYQFQGKLIPENDFLVTEV